MGLTLSSWTAVLARVRPYNCSKTQVWIRYFAKLKPLCKKNTVSLYNSHASQEGTFLCEQEVLLLRLCTIRLKNVLCFTPLGCCLFPYYYYYCMPSNNLTSQKANNSPEIVACTPLLIVRVHCKVYLHTIHPVVGFFWKSENIRKRLYVHCLRSTETSSTPEVCKVKSLCDWWVMLPLIAVMRYQI